MKITAPKNKTPATLFSPTFIFLVISAAFGQKVTTPQQGSLPASDTTSYAFKPIVVAATRSERPIYRVPYAIDIIELNDIQRAETGLSLEEALRAIPGVVVNNRYNLSQGDRMVIRGIGSRASFGVRGIKIIPAKSDSTHISPM
jgi:iron complex outermembrane receptor protein